MKIAMVMAEGFEESEFTIAYDLFKRADYKVDVYGLNKDLVSSHKLHLTDLSDLKDMVKEDYDLLYIPGGKKNFDILLNTEEVSELITYFFNNKN